MRLTAKPFRRAPSVRAPSDWCPEGARCDSPGSSPGFRVTTRNLALQGRASICWKKQRALTGLTIVSLRLYPGLRPGLSQRGLSGQKLRTTKSNSMSVMCRSVIRRLRCKARLGESCHMVKLLELRLASTCHRWSATSFHSATGLAARAADGGCECCRSIEASQIAGATLEFPRP